MSRGLLVTLALSSCAFAQAPRLAWSSFLDRGNEDVAHVVAPDADGNLWVAGTSGSNYVADAPNQPFQAERKGGIDVYLAKFRPEPDGATTLLFWTWFGGGGRDIVTAMKLGPEGRLYMTGYTDSFDFPLAGEAFQNTPSGGQDAWIAVFNPNESGDASLIFSSYWGGTRDELPAALDVAPGGDIVVVGQTTSDDLPNITGGSRIQESNRGGTEAFILRINFREVVYATYFGGQSTDGATGVAVDKNNQIWITGWTASHDFPATENALQNFLAIHYDAFVARLNTDAQGLDGLVYCTYLGGGGTDVAMALSFDELGGLWIGGYTTSTDLPVSVNPLQRNFSGFTDSFVFRFIVEDTPNPAIVYGSYYGGRGHEVFRSLTTAPGGRVVLAGYTMFGDLPVTPDALQPLPLSSFPDGFVAVINSQTGESGLEYSSYVGGEFTDVTNSVARDAAGNLFLAGYTNSYAFPVTDGSFRSNPPTLPSGTLQKITRE